MAWMKKHHQLRWLKLLQKAEGYEPANVRRNEPKMCMHFEMCTLLETGLQKYINMDQEWTIASHTLTWDIDARLIRSTSMTERVE